MNPPATPLSAHAFEAIALARECAARARQLARSARQDEAQAEWERGQQAVAHLPAPNAGSAELEVARGVLMYFGRDPEASIGVLLDARAQARSLGLAALEADAAASVALHLYLLDRSAESIEHAADALRLCSADDHGVRYRACLAVANTCQSEGAIDTAFRFYRQAMAGARALDDPIATRSIVGRMGIVQALEAMRLHLRGELDGETLTQAIVGVRSSAQWGEAPHPSQVALDQVVLAMLLSLQGQAGEADTLFRQWRPLVQSHLAPTAEADAACEHALCRLALGDTAGALALAEHARTALDRRDRTVVLPKVLRHVATVLQAAGHADADAVGVEAEQAWTRFETYREQRLAALRTQLREARLNEWIEQALAA